MSNYVGKSNIIDALKRYLVNLKSLFATKTELSGKADKATGAIANNLAKLDANGNPVDSGAKASDFASKTVVTNIANNIASILDGSTVVGKAQKDQNGNVIDTTYATKTENSAKANKVSGAVADDIATLDANGNLTDGGKKISDLATTTSVASKADKVSGATAGNIAKLDANGNLADGGIDASSLMAKRGNFVNNGLLMYSNGDIVDSGKTPDDIWLKADRDTDAVTGNVAEFDSNGNPIDGGVAVSDLATKAEVVRVQDVSGSTPSIAAANNYRYRCGTVSTLTITATSLSTIFFDVTFTSGSTPTVLTVPAGITWANGFDPTSLEANMKYELNIMDGVGIALATEVSA